MEPQNLRTSLKEVRLVQRPGVVLSTGMTASEFSHAYMVKLALESGKKP